MADALDPSSGAILAETEYLGLVSSFLNTWNRDPRAVWSSFSMIIVSEIGDKTFLIAAILSMRHPRPIVFMGAFSALAVMSVLSALLGVMFPTLLPKWLTTLLAALLFFGFGVRMMRDGLQMTGDEIGEEWEEAKREVEEEQDTMDESSRMELRSMEEGGGGSDRNGLHSTSHSNGSSHPKKFKLISKTSHASSRPGMSSSSSVSKLSHDRVKDGARNLCSLCFSPLFAQAFILTFLGEWGDRSQIATIALAAAHNIVLVSFGTIVGHALCTGMAVIAGSWIAKRISIRHVTLGGATMFLLFGIIYLYESRYGADMDFSPLTASVPTAHSNVDQAAALQAGLDSSHDAAAVAAAAIADPIADLPGR